MEYILAFTGHLMGWPVAQAAERSSAEEVKCVIQEIIIPAFGASRGVIRDIATCFISQMLRDFMKMEGTEWRTVLARVPISNGEAGKMAETIRNAIGRMMSEKGKEREEVLEKLVFGYRRRPVRGGFSPF